MSINQSTILRIARRTIVGFVLAVCAISAFAVLGDKGKNSKTRSLLSNETYAITPGNFSLKSNYNFRGSQIINTTKSDQYINLNTVVTYQKGNATYIVPLKKRIYITTTTSGIVLNH
jgi:hypothetical protein